jgi:hypothetical protein
LEQPTTPDIARAQETVNCCELFSNYVGRCYNFDGADHAVQKAFAVQQSLTEEYMREVMCFDMLCTDLQCPITDATKQYSLAWGRDWHCFQGRAPDTYKEQLKDWARDVAMIIRTKRAGECAHSASLTSDVADQLVEHYVAGDSGGWFWSDGRQNWWHEWATWSKVAQTQTHTNVHTHMHTHAHTHT